MIKDGNTTKLVAAVLSGITAPLPYTKVDLGKNELTAEAARELSAALQSAFSGGNLRILDVHGTKWLPPEVKTSTKDHWNVAMGSSMARMTTRTLAYRHEQVCEECCRAIVTTQSHSPTAI